VAEHAHRAAAGAGQTGQDADQRGLARAVRPEQAEELAGVDVEAHVVEGAGRAAFAEVRLRDVLEGDGWHVAADCRQRAAFVRVTTPGPMPMRDPNA